MRVEAEDVAADQRRRAGHDLADAAIAVLDRERELAVLEWCPHHPLLAHRHPPQRHQRFRPAGDAGVERSDQNLVRPGPAQLERPQLAAGACAQ